jgi:hypothetical protein
LKNPDDDPPVTLPNPGPATNPNTGTTTGPTAGPNKLNRND